MQLNFLRYLHKIIFLLLLSISFISVKAQVVLNEIMLNPLPDSISLQYQSLLNCTNTGFGSEYVEIYNNSKCDTMYLDCYILSVRTGSNNSGGFAFPAGTQIAPLDFIVVGGANVTNADFVLNSFCGSDSICGNILSLDNNVGYVALYSNDGSVSDAVFWTDVIGQPNELTTNSAFDFIPCIPARCVVNGNLKKPNEMTPGLEISYAGVKPTAGSLLHRSTDGTGGWQRTTNTTPNACNGVCQPISDLTVVLDTFATERCRLANGYLAAHAEGGVASYDFDWSNGDGDSLIANLTEGTYTITATDIAGCKDTFSIFVPNIGTPVQLTVDPAEVTIYQGDTIQLNMVTTSTIISIDWKPSIRLSCGNCANPLAYPNESRRYTINVADIDSCISSFTTFVKVLPDEKSVFIPNIFTPNNDGLNEGLFVRSIRIKFMDFRIFDRWGKEVFYTNDQNIPWTGKDKNGNDLANGVYAYLLEAVFNNGKERVFKGNITLVK